MKNFVFAILFLSALTAWFSFRGEIIPMESRKEGWAFYGTSGESVPSGEEKGGVDVFSINSPQEVQQAKAQPKAPITVTIVYPDTEHAEEYRQAVWETFWIGAAAGVLLAEILIVAFFAVLYLREKLHGH